MIDRYLVRAASGIVLALAMVGCGPSAAVTTLPSPENPPASAQPANLPSPESSSTQAQPIALPTVAGRPSAPAGINDDFRPDPVSVIAATGRPQLIEFFAFW